MTKEHRYILGKADYNRSGRRNCEVAITWRFCDGRLSMQAEVWNPAHTHLYMGGQCVDEVAAYFPHDAKAQRMVAIWRAYHLNDMHAGSPAQTAFLETVKRPDGYPHGMRDVAVNPKSYHDWECRVLAEAGLNPDPGYLHNGKPYKYGSAWLRVEVPADIAAEIASWAK